MVNIKYDVIIEGSRKIRIDALVDNSFVEYKARLSDIRILQSAFMRLAALLEEHPNQTAILIIDDARISISRLSEEWESWNKLFQLSIFSRIRMVVFSKGQIAEYFGDFTNEEIEALHIIQKRLWEVSKSKKSNKPDSFFEIFRVLLIHFFRGSGPLQINQLSQQTGFSFPTVSNVLEKLEPQLIRQSDRSVEFKTFPRDHWFKLLATLDNIREPQGYWTNKPRSVNDLINRLKENPNKEIALGGIIGASHYFPGIDLVGVHRLDLCVQNWSISKVDKIIRKLDPGLRKVKIGELPQVVVHNIRRPESLFTEGTSLPIADEVECLLDLYESRLESQANELLELLKERTR